MQNRVIKTIFAAIITAGMVVCAPTVYAKQCRDDKGKFIKCEAAAKPTKCRDASGKFAKCDAPGAKPVN